MRATFSNNLDGGSVNFKLSNNCLVNRFGNKHSVNQFFEPFFIEIFINF